MKVLLFIILLESLLFGNNIVRITNGEYKPFQSKDLLNYGFVSEIVSEAFLLEGIEVEYGFYPWVRSLELARLGQWDGTIGWAKTRDRERDFYFSEEPIMVSQVVFFYLSTTMFNWESMEDLKNYKIGAVRSYSYGKDFDDFAKENIEIIEYVAEDVHNIYKLFSGRIDVFPMDIDVGMYLVNKHFKNESKFIRIHEKILDKRPQYLLLSRKNVNNEVLMDIFNSAFAKLRRSGKENEILEKHKKLYTK